MAYADITEWLNSSKDYSKGLEICDRYVDQLDASRLTFVRTANNSLTRRKMATLLEELNATSQVVVASAQKAQDNRRWKPKPKDKFSVEGFPPALVAASERQSDLYAKMKHIKAQLWLLPTKQQRHVVAEEIATIYDEVTRIWFRLDVFREKGFDPEGEHPAQFYIDMMWDLIQIPAYLSKNRNRDDKAEILKEKRERLAFIKDFMRRGENYTVEHEPV